MMLCPGEENEARNKKNKEKTEAGPQERILSKRYYRKVIVLEASAKKNMLQITKTKRRTVT